jgi:diacylglycerol kinase
MRLFRSLRAAFRGLVSAFRWEVNFRIEALIAVLVIILAFLFPLTMQEKFWVLFLSGIILSLEIVNTACERVFDLLKPRLHPTVRELKDFMAAAVLLLSLIAAAIGILIFFPYV